MKKWLLKNEQGFTLVELMVVVAIIGVLSAVAIPNFKKYQGKSKQSEAKIQLAAVYTVEVSAQADYDAFATCLVDIGYDISPRGYYAIGFSADYQTALTDRGATCASSKVVVPSSKHLKAGGTAPTAISGTTSAATATATTFNAGAVGNIAGTLNDVWAIDNTKKLNNDVVHID